MKLSSSPFLYLFAGVLFFVTGVVVLGLVGSDLNWSNFATASVTSERLATSQPDSSTSVSITTAGWFTEENCGYFDCDDVVDTTTTKPFSFSSSLSLAWIDRYGRKRGNKSETGLFWGDVYVNGVSVRQVLEKEYDFKCGMVRGDYSTISGEGYHMWFASDRTTVNIKSAQAVGSSLFRF